MVRRVVFPIALLLAIGVALVFTFRATLAERVMRNVLEQNFGAEPLADFRDGLHVVLCGAGGPLPDPVRSGPCVAVVAGGKLFVVDAGARTALNMGQMGLAPGVISAVLLTHFHSDHIDGLGQMAMMRWVGAANTEPLPVFGPAGVDEVVAGYNRAYALDAKYRHAHHGDTVAPLSGAGMVARSFDVPESGEGTVIWNEGGLQVRAFRVEHEPVVPAVGYRFDFGGRSLVVSGDTKKSDRLLRHAQGVDVLAHEALSFELVSLMNESARSAGNAVMEKITHDIPDYHTSPVQVAEIAEAAGAGHLLYYHVVPALPLPGLDTIFLEGVADTYSGDVTLGVDGTWIRLPAGSEEIVVGER